MAIIITSRNDGFRRGGIAHSRIPVAYPDGHFTDDELAVLQAEPLLMVEVVIDEDVIDEAINAVKKPPVNKTKE